ncbi:unnamed protein product, partial [Rotaria socialis]
MHQNRKFSVSVYAIAAYLDPFTLAELSVEETNDAEHFIIHEAKTCVCAKQPSSTTTTTVTSSPLALKQGLNVYIST